MTFAGSLHARKHASNQNAKQASMIKSEERPEDRLPTDRLRTQHGQAGYEKK
jgi:hypothetical protein